MRRWLKFIWYSALIAGFIFLFPKVINKVDVYEQIIENSEELEIDNSSLFYSEEMWTSKAERELKTRLGQSED